MENLPNFCFKIQIIDRCNLNCCGCDHFAPLADENSFEQSLMSYSNTVSILKKLIPNNVKEIVLYGGEPLLHPDLIEFIKLTRIIFPNIYLTVQTNAILLDEFLTKNSKYCADNRIGFKITEYPPMRGITEKLSVKYPKVYIEYTKNDDYEYIDGNGKPLLFNVKLDIDSPKDKENNRQHCYCKTYETSSLCIRDNYIYACPITMCVGIFNAYFQNDELATYVKKYDINTLNIQQILDLSLNSTNFCQFCNGVQTQLPWSVSKKQKSEWIK